MFLLESLLINGIRFTLDKIRQVAEEQMENPEALQQQLLEAQMQLEDGTIDEETFATIERVGLHSFVARREGVRFATFGPEVRHVTAMRLRAR